MGTGIILQQNLANYCSSIWKYAPSIPQWSPNLNSYNKGFLNFLSLVGAYAIIKSSVWGTKKIIKLAKQYPKLPSKHKISQRYGSHSWALIVDCKQNEEYCVLLARLGFKLILCGEQDDIKIAHDRVLRETDELNFNIKKFVINWEQKAKDLLFYKQLEENLKDFDISIIVMPTISKQGLSRTSVQKSPAFEHIYLMTCHFGPKLKWRSDSSAIIIPSTQAVDQVDDSPNGVTRAVQSGIDAFGRTMQYELKGSIDILVARGSPEKALATLGKSLISK